MRQEILGGVIRKGKHTRCRALLFCQPCAFLESRLEGGRWGERGVGTLNAAVDENVCAVALD